MNHSLYAKRKKKPFLCMQTIQSLKKKQQKTKKKIATEVCNEKKLMHRSKEKKTSLEKMNNFNHRVGHFPTHSSRLAMQGMRRELSPTFRPVNCKVAG